MLISLLYKVNNIKKEICYISKEMEPLRIKNNDRNLKKNSNRNEEYL